MSPTPKKAKKKMVDISRPVSVHKEPESEIKSEPKPEPKKPEPKIIAVDKKLKKLEKEKEKEKLDKKIEEFEKKEAEQFKVEEQVQKVVKPKRFKTFTYVLIITLVVLMAAGVYAAITFLPRVEIKATTKKTDWSYVDSVIAGKNVAQVSVSQKQIPAEVFSAKKNFTASFPATGQTSSGKATGQITIYNKSSTALSLKANTRFATPDNKIFYLIKAVTGLKAGDQINAAVIASQPGPDYNIGPVSHFSIPGFKNSTTYPDSKVYGESKESMTGGGQSVYATDQDMANAKTKAASDLRDYIKAFLIVQIPSDFKTIDGSEQFNILTQTINPKLDDKNNFMVYSEAQLSIIAFKESDVVSLAEQAGQAQLGADFRIKSYKVDYGVGRSDFKQGQISFAVNLQGVFEQPINPEDLRQAAVGKSEADLKNLMSSFPNIQKAAISFWPFWVKSAPEDLNRIKVEVD